MASLTIYKEDYRDSTAVSNTFIDEYMTEANDAQLKVYLYLLRMINANLPTSVCDIADKFNHTEREVVRALQYWEKKGLLTLDFDENKILVGIHLCDISRIPTSASNAPHSNYKPITVDRLATVPYPAPVKEIAPAPVPVKEEVPDENMYVKPTYSSEQIRQFKEKDEVSLLLFVIQQYLGKPLSVAEIQSVFFMADVLNFSDDLIDYLVQYCLQAQKKDFRYMEKVAINWAQNGITTVEQAKALPPLYDKNVYTILKALGSHAAPTQVEVDYITRWTKEYCFDEEIIMEACKRTVLSTSTNRIKYADGILKKWAEQNVHHKSDILRLDENHAKSPASKPNYNKNAFNQFPRNEYDFDELEKQLLSN